MNDDRQEANFGVCFNVRLSIDYHFLLFPLRLLFPLVRIKQLNYDNNVLCSFFSLIRRKLLNNAKHTAQDTIIIDDDGFPIYLELDCEHEY